MRKLTITYDRNDALFELVEETEHGGVETSHCGFVSAEIITAKFLGAYRGAIGMLALLNDASRSSFATLTSITLEAP